MINDNINFIKRKNLLKSIEYESDWPAKNGKGQILHFTTTYVFQINELDNHLLKNPHPERAFEFDVIEPEWYKVKIPNIEILKSYLQKHILELSQEDYEKLIDVFDNPDEKNNGLKIGQFTCCYHRGGYFWFWDGPTLRLNKNSSRDLMAIHEYMKKYFTDEYQETEENLMNINQTFTDNTINQVNTGEIVNTGETTVSQEEIKKDGWWMKAGVIFGAIAIIIPIALYFIG